MDHLPVEVLLMIGNRLNNVDKLSLRIVCKKIHSDFTAEIFREVEVSYTLSSFENLLRVCSSESLNEHISSLYYHGTVCSDVPRATWESQIQLPYGATIPAHPKTPDASLTEASLQGYTTSVLAWIEASKPSKFYSEADLVAGFDAYNNSINQTKLLENSYTDFTSLATSIGHLKSLKSLYITTNIRFESGYICDKESRATALLPRPFGSASLAALPLKKIAQLSIRQTTAVLHAIFLALPSLQSLDICSIPWYVLGAHFGRGIHHGAFTHLKHLILEVSDYEDDFVSEGGIDHEKRQNILGQAIQSAKGLESLSLSFHRKDCRRVVSIYRHQAEVISWSRIFRDAVWLDLSKLEVFAIDVESSWLDFFPRQPRLRSLMIENPFLLEGKSWESTFDRMRDVVKLNYFRAQGVCYSKAATDTQTQELNMDGGLSQLSGRLDDEMTLGRHVEQWVLKSGPSPFQQI